MAASSDMDPQARARNGGVRWLGIFLLAGVLNATSFIDSALASPLNWKNVSLARLRLAMCVTIATSALLTGLMIRSAMRTRHWRLIQIAFAVVFALVSLAGISMLLAT